ncbi:MAG: GerMN domain-containing protein [Agathobacter sp.]
MKKRILCLVLSFILMFSLVGCNDEKNDPGEYQIFYLNREITKVEAEDYDSTGVQGEELVKELLSRLSEAPKSSKLRQTIPSDVIVNGVKTEGAYITVDFSQNYRNMSVIEEALVRVAIVKTLLQIEQYSLVSFTIEAEPLRTADGILVGNMALDSFVENPGAQINGSIQSTIKLYFSSTDGTSLVEETRVVTHSTSISMEKLVMEQLIDGPNLSKCKATIPAATKIINISVLDGVCYVNVDRNFYNQDQEIKEEIVLYSIVNSLTEITGVNKVQISVNGDTKGFCRYTYELSKMYEKNLDLLHSEMTEGAK